MTENRNDRPTGPPNAVANPGRGTIVVIEGLDGVGKSTLVDGLAAATNAKVLTTPGRDLRALRQAVEKTLGSSDEAVQLFYAASVLEIGVRARRLADEGQTVLIDRYLGSTLAYAAMREQCLSLVEVSQRVQPVDVTVLLSLDHHERVRRLQNRGMGEHDRMSCSPLAEVSLMAAYRTVLRQPWAGRLVEVDLTGLGRHECVERVVESLPESPVHDAQLDLFQSPSELSGLVAK